MNLTSIITLPARLGYEVTRRGLDLAAGAGRTVGLFGGSDEPVAEAEPKPKAARRPTRPKPGMDDVTLTRKVETEIFRVRGVAKGKIDVNAADGVVWLRGEAKTPELIKRVEARAAAIPEVARVENLLHLPKTPAPSRTDTPPSQRKTRTESDRTAAKATKAKAERAKAEREAAAPAPAQSDDHDVTLTREVAAPAPPATEPADGEPLPSDLAERGEGRQPVPLGAGDDAPGGGGDVRSSIP
jgi:hypothetical protein